TCVTPVSDAFGRSVLTIESLADGEALHTVQRAFVHHGAMQCGFCTPGMVIAATALLHENHRPSRAEIVDWMQPNLCRCGAYTRIIEAIHHVAERRAVAGHTVGAAAAPRNAPRSPWDLLEPADRDYFDVLGDGLVVV